MDSGAAARQFEGFYGDWFKRMDALVLEIRKLNSLQNASDELLQGWLQTLTHLWDELWAEKYKVIEGDILYVAADLWRTPFERAFSWIGGFRPSVLFQLIYAQIGVQTSQSLTALLEGQEASSLASLTSSQLTSLSTSQEQTIRFEEQLSNQLAKTQTTMPAQPLPPGAIPTNLSRQDSETGSSGSTADSEEVANPDPDARRRTALTDDATRRLQSLKRLLQEADRLRRETLRQVVSILNPIQALQFYRGLGELMQAQRTLGEALDGGRN